MPIPDIKTFNQLGDLMIQRYERYLPTAFDDSLTLLEKVNKVIEYVNQTGRVTNELIEFVEMFSGGVKDTVEEFILQFGDNLEQQVIDTLEEWQTSGKLDVVINEALQTQIDDLELQHTQDIENVNAQLAQIAYQVPPNATTLEMQTILDGAVNGSTIYLAQGTTYNFDNPILFGLNQSAIKIDGRGSTVRFTHNGDGFVLESQNENFGGHILENMIIQGPNASYPSSGYIPPSTGAGVKMLRSYYAVLRDVEIRGFNYGLFLHMGIKNNIEGKTYIRFNQYGVWFEGGATNVNNFIGVSIRNNRKIGVYFNSNLAPFPSHNVFSGCLIESNIPFPYLSGGNSPNDSVGVYIGGAYDNIFDNCYFENHQHAIIITGSSDANKFINCRLNMSADGSRVDGVWLKGDAINNTTFLNCHNSSTGSTVNVEYDGANYYKNVFKGCSGFVYSDFTSTSIDIVNSKTNQGGHGDRFGALVMDRNGFHSNPMEGTTPARIEGIGTTNAILNAKGYGEIILGTQITSATTITNISNLRLGQIFTLINHQQNHPVTIKSSTDGINGIVLRNRKDAILSRWSEMIVFYVSGLGRITEIGRNFNEPSKTTINSNPSYVGEIMVIGTDVYIATDLGYGAWKKVNNV